jgi:hypothetical protein
MTSSQAEQSAVLIIGEDERMYRVPQSAIELYRLSEAKVAEEVRAAATEGQEFPNPSELSMLRDIPQEVLESYRLSDEEAAVLRTPDEVSGYITNNSLPPGYINSYIAHNWGKSSGGPQVGPGVVYTSTAARNAGVSPDRVARRSGCSASDGRWQRTLRSGARA